MKKLLLLALLVSVALAPAQAGATIGWAGNVWPNSGSNHAPTGDISVYAQVWKDGCTNAPGACADLSAELFFQNDTMVAATPVPMTYLGEVGANDEFTANIPQSALVGALWVDVTVIFTDASDGSTFEVTGDQAGNPPLLRYNITNVLPNDVDVSFTLCMSGTPTAGDACVIGSASQIGAWGTGVNMVNTGGELWEVTVTFPAGAAPGFEYKYKKDACATWEGVGNRVVLLPTDGTTAVSLGPDSWDNAPIGCGLGNVLDEDKTICLQVCMAGTDNTGGVCAIGNIAQLTGWTVGVPMTHIGGDLWEVCVTIPTGAPIPINAEYKFKKDDCNTWENTGNRTLTIDNSSPSTQTLTHSWDAGGATCVPVEIEAGSFGTLKSRY